MRRFTVLVVDDSAFMRKLITDIVTEHGDFEVIGTARNGKEAVDKVVALKPDVVTLDVEMPIMNGLDALREMMTRAPVPVIMLSSLTDAGTKETIKALEWGAIDFVRKPSGSISLDLYKVKDILIEKLKMAVHANVKPLLGPQTPTIAPLRKMALGTPKQTAKPASNERQKFESIVAIGTSTGGPKALQSVLGRLPADFSAPVVVVQHMPPAFTRSLADRLDTICQMRVVEAQAGMSVEQGTIYIAPGGYHMKVMANAGTYTISLTTEPLRSGHRPSVDMLFESLVPLTELRRYAVLLTGMGADGAKAMKLLKDSGAIATIAEAEQTCVVFGMPRSAIEMNAVDYVEPLHDVAEKLIQIVKR